MPIDRDRIRSSIVDIVVGVALVLFFIYSGFKEIKRDVRDASFKDALLANQIEQNKRMDIAITKQEQQLYQIGIATRKIEDAVQAIMQVDMKVRDTQETVQEMKKETVNSGGSGPPIP